MCVCGGGGGYAALQKGPTPEKCVLRSPYKILQNISILDFLKFI